MNLHLIQNKIYEIRGLKVMLDFDLAEMYEVKTKVLNQAVKRNYKRFPIDFMFRLSEKEWEIIRSQPVPASKGGKTLISQFVTSKTEKREETMRSQIVTASKKRNIIASPFAFTEQGLAMLSGVLNSKKAINVNIAIMRAFVFIRQYALTHKDLTAKLTELETTYNKQFKDVYEALDYLLQKDKQQKEQAERKRIGFRK